ncbi:MAG: efflux RND transporter permease subunit [Spirochaetaceae bacterium]|nr:MAG: efflux RND transporter permease subunit [Spirochaetaceae bacterium]
MKSILEFFAKRHILATLITVMILLVGLNSLRTLKRDLYPHVDFGLVEISTMYPGASPEDVELNVTNKIEDELKSVTGIDRITSTSMENMSSISITLDPDVKDQEKVKNEIREAVGRVTDFPPEVTESPFIIDIDTSWINVIEVGIAGDLPYDELREIARVFEKKLKDVPGVKMLSRYGYRAREVRVEVSPQAMDRYQIPLREIIAAIQARNIRATAGTFESYTSEKNVVALAQFRDSMEVGDVIVRSTFEGPLVKIKDLAIVKDDFEEESVISHVEGRKAISFVVFKSEEADIIRTVRAIKRLIRKEAAKQIFAPELEPEEAGPLATLRRLFRREREEDKVFWFKYGNVRILYSQDLSVYVQDRFNTVTTNLLIGLVLVILVLTIFLPGRTAFWVAMGIPVSVMGVFFLLPMFGAFLDILSLSSLILMIGIIVDDGIIISENINRWHEKGASPLEAAVAGTQEVFLPVVTTVLTTCLVFVPMFFMTGMIGKFVYVIPLVVILALLVSLFEAVCALPAHIQRGLEKASRLSQRARSRAWFDKLRGLFRKVEYHLLRFRYLLIGLFIIAFGAALWYASNYMEFILFPTKTADYIEAEVELPAGTPLEATEQTIIEIEKIIKEMPETELQTFVSRIGTSETKGRAENYASILIGLTPFAERTRTAHEIIEELRAKAEQIEGVHKIVFEVAGGGPPTGRPVDLRIVGPDDEMRTKLADQVMDFLEGIDGIKDLDRDDKLGKEQIEIEINHERLARRGLTVADVAQNVRIAYDGEVVTSIRDGDEDVEFRVQLVEVARKDIRYLQNLAIPNVQGRLIKLQDVARLVTGPGPTAFRHFDGERAISVTGDIDQDVTTPLEVRNAVFEHFNLEEDWPGLKIVVGGEAEESEKAVINLSTTFLIAFLGIYFLLVLLFNSYIQPIFVVVAIPFGLIGVIIALALHGEPLGFFALIGTIGLTGVVVNDSLVMVSHLNTLIKQRRDANILEIVAEGASDRLRAIILTSLTTVSGLIPLAYGIGGTDEWMAPMALTLGYGILFATPLTLVLVPCLYVVRNDLVRLFTKKRATRPA